LRRGGGGKKWKGEFVLTKLGPKNKGGKQKLGKKSDCLLRS